MTRLPVMVSGPINRAAYDRRAQVLKAMAHASRLMIIDALSMWGKSAWAA